MVPTFTTYEKGLTSIPHRTASVSRRVHTCAASQPSGNHPERLRKQTRSHGNISWNREFLAQRVCGERDVSVRGSKRGLTLIPAMTRGAGDGRNRIPKSRRPSPRTNHPSSLRRRRRGSLPPQWQSIGSHPSRRAGKPFTCTPLPIQCLPTYDQLRTSSPSRTSGTLQIEIPANLPLPLASLADPNSLSPSCARPSSRRPSPSSSSRCTSTSSTCATTCGTRTASRRPTSAPTCSSRRSARTTRAASGPCRAAGTAGFRSRR